MKNLLILFSSLVCACPLFGQQQIQQYTKFELTYNNTIPTFLTSQQWQLVDNMNPFDKEEVVLKAEFVDPKNTPIYIEGSYYRLIAIVAK